MRWKRCGIKKYFFSDNYYGYHIFPCFIPFFLYTYYRTVLQECNWYYARISAAFPYTVKWKLWCFLSADNLYSDSTVRWYRIKTVSYKGTGRQLWILSDATVCTWFSPNLQWFFPNSNVHLILYGENGQTYTTYNETLYLEDTGILKEDFVKQAEKITAGRVSYFHSGLTPTPKMMITCILPTPYMIPTVPDIMAQSWL